MNVTARRGEHASAVSRGLADALANVLSNPLLKGTVTARPWGAVAAVLVATLMTSFYTRYFSLALADLRGVWGLSVDEGAELNTVVNALQLLSAPAIPLAAAIFGARRIILYCALLFALTTGLTPFASGHLAVFLLHGLTGVLLGCFVPATLATIFRNLPPKFWLLPLALYTARLTLTLHGGVTLTATYVEHLGWQGMYWQATVCSLAVAALAAWSIPAEPVNKVLLNMADKGGAAMFCIALTLLYAGLDEGNRLDWFESGEIGALIGGGLLLFAAFLLWQRYAGKPFAHPRVLANRNGTMAMLIGLFFGMLNMGSAMLIPNFLGTVGGLKAEQSGDILWVVVALQLVCVPLAMFSIRRLDARLTLAFGIVCMMIGCWYGSQVTHEWRGTDFLPVVLWFAPGCAFCFLSIMVLAVANSRPPDILSVLAYAQIARVLAPTFSAAIVSTLLRKREAVHSALLAPYVDSARDIVRHALANGPGAVSMLGNLVRREAYVLAFHDLNMYGFWCGVAGLCLVALMRSSPPNPLTPTGLRPST
jgi:DHA2 family multidrug resistance protein